MKCFFICFLVSARCYERVARTQTGDEGSGRRGTSHYCLPSGTARKHYRYCSHRTARYQSASAFVASSQTTQSWPRTNTTRRTASLLLPQSCTIPVLAQSHGAVDRPTTSVVARCITKRRGIDGGRHGRRRITENPMLNGNCTNSYHHITGSAHRLNRLMLRYILAME